jgi:glutamyl-tRNA reductase
MMHTIFHANKRVQQETEYRDGAASVSYAAAELAAELTTHLQRPSVLVLGLGEMGRDVARNLELDRFTRIALCNRTQSKADALAAELGAMVLPMEQLAARAHEFDVIIASPTVSQPLILPEMLQGNAARSKFIIDLSVPRSVAREVEALPNVILYNIDEIQTRTAQVLDRRREAIPQVQRIIAEEVGGFESWAMELSISPVIQKMKDALEQIRKEELARFLKNATERETELLENVTRSMINKLMKAPVLQLKEACKRGEQESLIELLQDIFNLETRKERA